MKKFLPTSMMNKVNQINSGKKASSPLFLLPKLVYTSRQLRAIPLALCIVLSCCAALASASPPTASSAKNIIDDNCKACHGLDGKAQTESWPNLNCQNRGYLYKRLHAFGRGDNDHTIDNRVSELSFDEIDYISHYYSETVCSNTAH